LAGGGTNHLNVVREGVHVPSGDEFPERAEVRRVAVADVLNLASGPIRIRQGRAATGSDAVEALE
jgi:hypothetical protein